MLYKNISYNALGSLIMSLGGLILNHLVGTKLDLTDASSFIFAYSICPMILMLYLPYHTYIMPKYDKENREEFIISSFNYSLVIVVISILIAFILFKLGKLTNTYSLLMLLTYSLVVFGYPYVSYYSSMHSMLADNIVRISLLLPPLLMLTVLDLFLDKLLIYHFFIVFIVFNLVTASVLIFKINKIINFSFKPDSIFFNKSFLSIFLWQISSVGLFSLLPLLISLFNHNAVYPFYASLTIAGFISGVSSIFANPYVLLFRDSYSKGSFHLLKNSYVKAYYKFFAIIFFLYMSINILPDYIYIKWIGAEAFDYLKYFIFPVSSAVFIRQVISPLSSLLISNDLISDIRFSSIMEFFLSIFFVLLLLIFFDSKYAGWGLFAGSAFRFCFTFLFDVKNISSRFGVNKFWFLLPL